MPEQMILVDQNDCEIGTGEKMDVHLKGMLHRAFSILIYNKSGELLIQQRAAGKYHSAGRWANACCGHPRIGESLEQAASRRLEEELGFTTPLTEYFELHYKVELGSNMIEHEYVHIFKGIYEGDVPYNRDEAQAIKWIPVAELLHDMKAKPDHYAAWFQIYRTQYLASVFDTQNLGETL